MKPIRFFHRVTQILPIVVLELFAGVLFTQAVQWDFWVTVVAVVLGAVILASYLHEYGRCWPYWWASPGFLVLMWFICVICFLRWTRVPPAEDLSTAKQALALTALFAIVVAMVFFAPFNKGWKMAQVAEHSSLSVSCFPYKLDGTSVLFYLICNPNFEWWLPVGGHVDLSEEDPVEVVRGKALTEAGIDALKLVGGSSKVALGDGCEQLDSAPLIFKLKVPTTARCRKEKHHEWHYDLCYIGEVTGDSTAAIAMYKVLKVRVELTCNQVSEVDQCLRNALRDSSHRLDSYPEDLPARMLEVIRVVARVK